MPPIPITFHTHSTSHSKPNLPVPGSTARRPLYYSVHTSKPVQASDQQQTLHLPSSTHIPVAKPKPAQPNQRDNNPSNISSSSSSTTTPVPPPSVRRKRTAHRAPSASDVNPKYINLTPLNTAIITRCLLHSTPSAMTVSPRKVGSSSKQSSHPAPVHPYSRLADLGNDRSANPSPRELLRAQRAEQEKQRSKKDSVAVARAAIAAKRKKGKSVPGKNGNGGGGGGKSGKVVTRSPSPTGLAALGSGAAGLREMSVLPTIITEPVSTESSPLPATGPTARSLKRTRSSGVVPLATGLANSLGTGNIGIGSPLKAVIGAQDTDEGDAAERGRAKRSRTHEPVNNPSSSSTVPPPSNPLDKDSIPPKTFPLAPGQLVPSAPTPSSLTNPTRQSNRFTGISALAAESATGMRRAVSASGLTVERSSRRDSAGSQGSEGGLAGRSRREVNLPRALRDYEMRATTTTA